MSALKVAIYCRVSTRDKEQNPDVQLQPLRRYAEAMQWEVAGEYIDKARAADLVKREQWATMMKLVPFHGFDVLLIWKLDRAFRDVKHCSNTIAELNTYKIGFRSLMDPTIDTTTPNGRLLMNVLAAMAEFEKDLDSVRIREGIDHSRKHGTKSGKSIGKPRHPISDEEVLAVLYSCDDNRSAAAKKLSQIHNIEVTPGFVSLRAKRALQIPAPKVVALQT